MARFKSGRLPAPIVRQDGEPGPYLELLVDGFLRVFVRAPDGRSLTVRYVRRGDVTGVVSLFTPDYSLGATMEALVDSDLLHFRADVAIGLAERDTRVAQGNDIDELSERVVSFVAEIPGSAFSTVRQRVARHLLDLASERPQGEQLVGPGQSAGARRRRWLGPRGRRPCPPRPPVRGGHPHRPRRDRDRGPGGAHGRASSRQAVACPAC